MKKAVVYARQSSGSESNSESIEVQIRNCVTLAEKMNLELLDIFYDHNVSGKTYPDGYEAVASQDYAFLSWFASQTGHKKFRCGLGKMLKILSEADFLIVDGNTMFPFYNTSILHFAHQHNIIFR